VVLVHGKLFKEQKFHNTDTFVGPDLSDTITSRDGNSKSIQYRPRILIATAGSANAGLDSPHVRYVIRDGFPSSLPDLIQELGRAGRYPLASPSTDQYWLVVSLPSFVSLLFRIYVVPLLDERQKKEEAIREQQHEGVERVEDNTPWAALIAGAPEAVKDTLVIKPDELQQRQYSNLLDILALTCLRGRGPCPQHCIHLKMETAMLNPYVDPVPLSQDDEWNRCNVSCWDCKNDPSKMYLDMPVCLVELRACLIDIFVVHPKTIEDLLLYKNKIVETMVSYKKNPINNAIVPTMIANGSGDVASPSLTQSQKANPSFFTELVFGKFRKQEAQREVKALILKLFACRAIVPALDGTRLYCKLAIDDNAIYKINEPNGLDGFIFI
jgi:hypothetical protein